MGGAFSSSSWPWCFFALTGSAHKAIGPERGVSPHHALNLDTPMRKLINKCTLRQHRRFVRPTLTIDNTLQNNYTCADSHTFTINAKAADGHLNLATQF